MSINVVSMNDRPLPPNFQLSVFYQIERAIKRYRQFALLQLRETVPGITVNQALLLALIRDRPDTSQSEMATILFKDQAALTRTLELLVRSGYVVRAPNSEDRRRSRLLLSQRGQEVTELLDPVITANRAHALQGLSEDDLTQLRNALNLISANCQTTS